MGGEFRCGSRVEGRQLNLTSKCVSSQTQILRDRLFRIENREFQPATGKNRQISLNTEEDRARVAERLIDLSRQQLAIDLEALRQKEQAARESAVDFKIPGTDLRVKTFNESYFDNREEEIRQRTDTLLNSFVESLEQAQEKIRRIENAYAD